MRAFAVTSNDLERRNGR